MSIFIRGVRSQRVLLVGFILDIVPNDIGKVKQ